MGVIVAVDPGTRYIGIAVSNPERTLSFPLTVIDARSPKQAVQAILTIVRERKAEQLVIGRPVNLRGGRTPQTDMAETLIQELQKNTELPIAQIDERLTTVAAKRAPGQKGRPDASAAALMLEAYLGRQRGGV